QYPPYPNRQYAYHGPMHRPMPQRSMPQRPMPMPHYEQAESSFVPKAPSMWLWLSIPVTILFGGSVFGIVAIILGIISRKKYKAGAYGTAIKLSRACEWLLMIGITLGFAIIPFSMFV
ncbi:MAG: CD225/dispanin family protein, partial [Muribaculaceae bacterium]|nr:CD225/dispanin family protein [Muribaculaceae bacterium]